MSAKESFLGRKRRGRGTREGAGGGGKDFMCPSGRGAASVVGGGRGCWSSTKPIRLNSRFFGRYAGYLTPGGKLQDLVVARTIAIWL